MVTFHAEDGSTWLTSNASLNFRTGETSFEAVTDPMYSWTALKGAIELSKDYYIVVYPFAFIAADRFSVTFVNISPYYQVCYCR